MYMILQRIIVGTASNDSSRFTWQVEVTEPHTLCLGLERTHLVTLQCNVREFERGRPRCSGRQTDSRGEEISDWSTALFQSVLSVNSRDPPANTAGAEHVAAEQ